MQLGTASPLYEIIMRQKMATSIVIAALDDIHAAEVYLLDHPQTILRHLRSMYNLQCSANINAVKREYLTLCFDDGDSMFEHMKETRRLLGELFEYGINIPDEDRKANFIQRLGPTWNGFIGCCKEVQSSKACSVARKLSTFVMSNRMHAPVRRPMESRSCICRSSRKEEEEPEHSLLQLEHSLLQLSRSRAYRVCLP